MRVLFDIFPSYGHQHASYKLAHILQEASHHVCYIGEPPYMENVPAGIDRKYIPAHIFNFIEYKYDTRWKNIKFAFRERKNHRVSQYNRQIIRQYDQLIAEFKPDVILLDHHYVQKAILYYSYQVPVISIQTAPASEMDIRIPPFRSSHIPTNSFYSRIYTWYLWQSYLWIKKGRQLISRIVYFGEDHLSDVKRMAKQTGFPLKRQIDHQHYKGFGEFGLKNIPQLLLSPRDFDFPRPLKPNQYAVGPLLYDSTDETIQDKRYLCVIDHLIKEKKQKKTSLLYCSLGTLNSFGIANSFKIFKYVIEIAKQHPEYRIILSIGEYLNSGLLLPTPDNVFMFKSLPQKHLLKHCDLMIAHGGQNSITECIMNEVPLLIYPFFNGSDLGGNSARVVYHTIGNRGFIHKETVDDMEANIKDVLHNPRYRRSIREMRLRFEIKNQSKEAITIIESIVHAYRHS